MNIFKALKLYPGGWKLEEERPFSEEELEEIADAKTHEGDYGMSVMLFLKSGEVTFIPIDNDYQESFKEGIKVDLKKSTIKRLSRPGEKDIYRIIP